MINQTCFGDVIYVYCNFIKPPDYKYCVCIDSSQHLFFFINTNQRRKSPDADVLVTQNELPFLKYNSYINTATPIRIIGEDLKKGDNKGQLPDNVIMKILKTVYTSIYISPFYKKIIWNNISSKMKKKLSSCSPIS